jgi:prevent-host-death family protein
MKMATITQVKNGLSAFVDAVRAGETVVITDRGVPVARLEPITTLDDPGGRLKRLERAGLVRTAAADPPLALLRSSPPRLKGRARAVEVLLDERRSGR